MAGERIGIHAGEDDDAVRGVGQALVVLQRAGEHLEQAPPDQDADRHPGGQRRGGLEQSAAPHLCPKLLAGQDQQGDHGDVEAEPDDLADVLHDRFGPGRQVADVPADGRDHV